MRTVTIYTKAGCQFSDRMRELLVSKDIPHDEHLLVPDSPEHQELGKRTGSMKLPQAFLGAVPLGSTAEVSAAAADGTLDELVADD